MPSETSLPGVFAAGGVRHRSVKRVAAAVAYLPYPEGTLDTIGHDDLAGHRP